MRAEPQATGRSRTAVTCPGSCTCPVTSPAARSTSARTWTWNSSASRAPAASAASRSTREATASSSWWQPGQRQPLVGAQQRVLLGRHPVERLHVGPQLRGGPGQGLGDPGAELALEQRQHRVADPAAGEPRVGVVGVVPPPDPLRHGTPASVSDRRTSSSGRTNTSYDGRMPAIERPPLPRVRPSSTVSAWSSRVWPSSTRRAPNRLGDLLEHGVAGLAGGGLGSLAAALDADPGGDGLVGPERGHRGHDLRRRGRPSRPAARGRRSRRRPAPPAPAPRGRWRRAARASRRPRSTRRPPGHRARGRRAPGVRRDGTRRPGRGATRV